MAVPLILQIHQPSKEIVAMFDLLLLMARGRVVYFGPMADAVHFFTSAPYHLPFVKVTPPADCMRHAAPRCAAVCDWAMAQLYSLLEPRCGVVLAPAVLIGGFL